METALECSPRAPTPAPAQPAGDVLCTVCAVRIPDCVPCLAHPRLSPALAVACCGVCHDALEEEDGDDACAWCGDGGARPASPPRRATFCNPPARRAGTLLCCDDCDRAWCRACLARHVGDDYAALAEDLEVWRCVACEPPEAARALERARAAAAAARGGGDDDEGEATDATRAAAEAALMAFESELADAQELLEGESVDAVRGAVYRELEGACGADELGAAVAREVDEWLRLQRRRHACLEREHALAQERAEARGVDLAAFYAALSAADATGAAAPLTQAWRAAPKVHQRRRGRVRGLVAAGDDDDVSDGESEATYDGISDDEARASHRAAEAYLADARPIKRKRGAGGATRLEGAVGASGFEARRAEELGADRFGVLYDELDPTAPRLRAALDSDDDDDVLAIEELDGDSGGDEPTRLAFAAERKRLGAARVARYDDAGDRAAQRRGRAADAARSRGAPRPRPRPRASAATAAASPAARPRRAAPRAPRRPADGGGEAWTRVERKAGVFALLHEPARDGRAARTVDLAEDTDYVLGRAHADAPANFLTLGAASNKRMSRLCATLRVGAAGLRVARLAGAKTRVRVDGVEAAARPEFAAAEAAVVRASADHDAAVAGGDGVAEAHVALEAARAALAAEAQFRVLDAAPDGDAPARVHVGNEARASVGGALEGPADVRAYVVAATADPATGDAYFALPPYEARDFDDAADRTSTGASDDPILVDDEDLVGAGLADAPRKKRALAAELGDDELCESTRAAVDREEAKRARLERRRLDRASLERAAPPPAPPLPPEDDDDYDDLGDVAVVALNDGAPERRVVVPKYLGYRLKEHQVEAARFLYDQTVESLDLLEDPDADAFGCVLAHSMGLGKTLTCIAYMAALLKDPAARRRVRTCLVVCPTNVVRNWAAEFRKWCGRDRHLVGRVVVVDRGARSRVDALETWQRLGGVCVVGYDFFHALVGKRGEKKRKRKKKMDLAALLDAGVVEAGGGCLSVDGRAVEADLNRDGSIQWEGERFASASAFAKRVLKVDKVNGHAKVTYKGESLVAVRDRADDLEDDEGEPEADAAADDPDVAACRRCLQDPGPDVVVLDEAHTIKNPKSKRHEALSRIRTKRRVALTGTPLQNNLLEYHTMISYVRGAVLGTRAEFKNRFVDPIDNGLCRDSEKKDVTRMKKRMFVLQDLIKDFVLRRDESLLAKEMGKTEYLVTTKLRPAQRAVYGAFLAHRRAAGARVNVMAAHQPILKLGNHPLTHLLADGDGARVSVAAALAAGDRARVEAALRERDGAGAAAEAAAGAAWSWRGAVGDALRASGAPAAVDHSAKTLLLFELLSECLKRGDKMVVFTQSLATLDFLEHALASETWGGLLDPNRDRIRDALDHGGAVRGGWRPRVDFFRIEGSVAAAERQKMVEARAAQESEIPNFKGSDLGHFPLVSADFWTSDHLSERPRSVDVVSVTRARGTLTLKRR